METSKRETLTGADASRELLEAIQLVNDAEIDDEAKREIEENLRAWEVEWHQQLGRELNGQARAAIKAYEKMDRKAELERQRRAARKHKAGEGEEMFQRFSVIFRAQHMLLFTSVILLVATGMPLKFPESAWAKFLFHTLGAFASARLVHRIAAVGLISVGIFHIIYITCFKEGRKMFMDVLPKPKDAFDVIANLKYFAGLSKLGARFGRFSYIEKFDYWAVYWGIVVMVVTGSALWFKDLFMAMVPKFVIDIMKEAHSDEALLATLALVIWHFYNVHFNPDRFPGTLLWWHGKISKEEMIKEHPLEYEEIMKKRLEQERGEQQG